MSVALAVLSAAATLGGLPQLPQRGLALETKAGVQLQTMAGKPVASLPGLDLAEDWKTAGAVTMRDRVGTIYVLDVRRRRLRNYGRPQTHPACRYTDVGLSVCKHVIRSGTRVVARAPGQIGHWVWASRAPRGDAILAQWSAECESPVAYLIANGKLRAFGGESVALGWLPTAAAVIQFPNGPCAAGWSAAPGIYAVTGTSKLRRLVRTKRFAQYLMWGG
jgi:hypothetical protein